MANGAPGDGLPELGHPFLDGGRSRLVQRVERVLGHLIELVPVALDELDDDGVLGVEVVVQAAGQDAAGITDLLERGPDPR